MKLRVSSFSIILIFVCLSLVGLALVPLLPVKLSPSQALPNLSVSFSMRGNASRVVEMEVTSKMEAMLSRLKGIESIHSTSGNGWGRINIRFDKHVNIDAARFEVSTIIRQTWPGLPDGVSYPTIYVSRSDNNASRPFLTYRIISPANPIIIQNYAENNIKPKLSQIEGVNQVNISGSMPLEWRLEYDYKQLEVLGISITDIQNAIQHYLNQEFLGIASIENEEANVQWIRIALVSEGVGKTGFHPENVIVKNKDDKLITLDQLVSVTHAEQRPYGYYHINGLNSIYMSITADEDANQLELSKIIKTTLEDLKPSFPPNYEVRRDYDATKYIKEELDKVYYRSGLTVIILLLFVLLIYRSWKYLLMITFSLIINIAVAVVFYYFLGLEMQLYSLAGITISLTLIIDNTIVMSDQILRRHNKKAFLAILTATLTTISSLIIIFFMDEQIRLNLLDFAKVIMINLSLSLFVALFLVPALIEKLKMQHRKKKIRGKKLYKTPFYISFRRYFDRFYAAFCRFMWRWKTPVCILVILIFGLPVFLIPEKLDGKSRWDELFNETLGSSFYKEKIKPYSDVVLGGTLRLFVEKVVSGSYFTTREETQLHVAASLPNGSTLDQMNNLIQRMEVYISQHPEVKQFITNIYSPLQASISIQFTEEGERSGFPFMLQSQLRSKAIELGGGSWTVSGLGDYFNNNVRETAGSYKAILKGYNYDELLEHAEAFKNILLEHRRIKEVTISSEFSHYKDDYSEFVFQLYPERLSQENITPTELFTAIKPVFGKDEKAGEIIGSYGREDIVLNSRQAKQYDIWSLDHIPFRLNDNKDFKLTELAKLEKTQAPQNVVKENQQYRLCLQYEYVGSYQQGNKVLERNVEEYQKMLPMGYTIESQQSSWNWQKKNAKQYALLLMIFVITFFTCSILFNSLRQPFAVIFVIPIAYIGIFLAFYLFKLNFDQGGFASFILISGLSVNANIYIINEYNNILQKRKISPLQAYIKAWNAKISPIFLTVISTILGFIPFMIGGKEAFWFPLAAGTIGGLIVSLIASFLFLPIFMGVAKNAKSKN
ncbi:MAG: efflux RND transporter permease subunit [Bacteroidales bacterium]|nr:efflux RND transporter permease subunit [Bacteroidales bacterium]